MDREGLHQALPKHGRCPNYNCLWFCNFVLSRDRELQLGPGATANCRALEEGPSPSVFRWEPELPGHSEWRTFLTMSDLGLGPKRCLEPSAHFPALLVLTPSWLWSPAVPNECHQETTAAAARATCSLADMTSLQAWATAASARSLSSPAGSLRAAPACAPASAAGGSSGSSAGLRNINPVLRNA